MEVPLVASQALLWLVTVVLVQVASLPLTLILLRNLPDRGFGLSKPLGILLLSYVLWLGGSLHLLPNNRPVILLALLVLTGVSTSLALRRWREWLEVLRREWVGVVLAEVVFVATFALWVSLRAFDPGISGTEKPMDFAFLNASVRASFFPPEDPWLSGYGVSYYYFGYMMMGTLTELTGLSSSVTYNLSLALLGAMAASAAFSLLYNLIRSGGARPGAAAVGGLLAAFLLTIASNVEGVLELVRVRGWGSDGFWSWVGIEGLKGSPAGTGWLPTEHWWWWKASRVIPDTINEFPFFSLLLGDMHPHIMALPFTIATLGLGLNLYLSPQLPSLAWFRDRKWEMLGMAILLGSLGFLNTWDLPTFASLIFGVILLRHMASGSLRWMVLWRDVLPLVVALALAAVILYLPFYLGLGTQAKGILPVRDVGSRPLHLLIVWGVFLLPVAGLLAASLRPVRGQFAAGGAARHGKLWRWALGLLLLPELIAPLGVVTLARRSKLWLWTLALSTLPFLLWAAIVMGMGVYERQAVDALLDIGSRLGRLMPILAAMAIVLYSLVRRSRDGRTSSALLFALLMLTFALLLILGPELFYVKDFLAPRFNTVFKVYYQVWTLLAMVSAYGIYYCLSSGFGRGRLRIAGLGAWSVGVVAVLLAAMYYPAAAFENKAGRFRAEATLDGLAFIQRYDKGEYEAIQWLKENAHGTPVILEALGGQYSEFGRISSTTGLPTVIGWEAHELQWRGSYETFAGRAADVATIYKTQDWPEASVLMGKYGVRYVVVGPRERQAYGSEGLAKFERFARPVFSSEDVVIYEVR